MDEVHHTVLSHRFASSPSGFQEAAEWLGSYQFPETADRKQVHVHHDDLGWLRLVLEWDERG